jgi:hypothetical protein
MNPMDKIRLGALLVAAGLAVQLVLSWFWTPLTFVISVALGVPLVALGVGLFVLAVWRFILDKGAL